MSSPCSNALVLDSRLRGNDKIFKLIQGTAMGLNQSHFPEKPAAPFYEVWYFKLNCPEKRVAFWVHFNVLNSPKKKIKKADVFAVCFDEQMGQRAAKASYNLPLETPYYTHESPTGADCISIGNALWKSMDSTLAGETEGELVSGADKIKWKCKVSSNKIDKPFFHVPHSVSRLKLNRSTVLTPFPNLKFSGFFSVNDRLYEFQDAQGMQGHIYGTEEGRHWGWAHCNQVESGEYFVFEGLCVSTLLGGLIPSPPLSLFLIAWEDERFLLNTLNSAFRCRNKLETTRWDFFATTGEWRFEGSCSAEPPHMVGVTYDDTQGENLFCHNSMLASLELKAFHKDTLYKLFRSHKTSAFERVKREMDPRVSWLL